MKSKRTGSGP